MGNFNIQLAEKLSKTKGIISFDMYDTLVKRNVPIPAMVFDLVSWEYSRRFGLELNFRNSRIEAERKARETHKNREITLDEIYNYLDFSDKEIIKEIEKNIELNICVPNYPVIDFYKKCISENKRVIIISDMYLPLVIIDGVLKKCGVTEYEKLYVSSEVGVEKRTGKLYDYVLQDLEICPREIIHFGDRKKTDNIIPMLKGMRSFYVPPCIINTNIVKLTKTSANSIVYKFINNMLPKYSQENEMFQYGYEAFGPLLLGYCTWVYNKVKEIGVERIFFLARDMNLIIQVYKKLYGKKNIDYLEVSRNSLRNDYIISQKRLDAVFETMTRRQYTSKEILDMLEIDEEDFNALCKSEGIKFDQTEKFHSNYEIPEWFNKVNTKALSLLKEKSHAISYLTQHGLFQNERMAIVDIGWHGTIQNMLEKITGKHIIGLYFGTTKRDSFDEMEMYGYWFKAENEKSSNEYTTMTFILESMLLPKVGTTIGYDIKDGETVPVYAECEINDFASISNFQRGAMTFVDDYIDANLVGIGINSAESVRAYLQMANCPSLHQAKAFAEIRCEDGREYTLAKCRPLSFYMFHPRILLKDYGNVRWKEGFIKQLFPIINNPHKLNMAIKKIVRRVIEIYKYGSSPKLGDRHRENHVKSLV